MSTQIFPNMNDEEVVWSTDGTGALLHNGKMMCNVYTLEYATREALHGEVGKTALRIPVSRGINVFSMVHPRCGNAFERLMAVREYCEVRAREDKADTDLAFVYSHGITAETPCGVCDKTRIWGSCGMQIIRPCGHVVCSQHGPSTRRRCMVCKRRIDAILSRDSIELKTAVLESYYDGFIEHVQYNNWFALRFSRS